MDRTLNLQDAIEDEGYVVCWGQDQEGLVLNIPHQEWNPVKVKLKKNSTETTK